MEPSQITATDPLDDVDVLDGAVQLGELAAALYGPEGRYKLVVTGEPVVASDLQQLFDALDVEHPAAVMVGNGAVQQKERVGDGSTAVWSCWPERSPNAPKACSPRDSNARRSPTASTGRVRRR